MTQRQLFWLLYRNVQKGERRTPGGSGRRPMALVVRVCALLGCLYLAMCGIGLGFLARDISHDAIFGVMPFILLLDFSMRFVIHKWPIELKPYLLLPIKKSDVTASFVIMTLARRYNLSWQCLFGCYAVTTGIVCGTPIYTLAAIVVVCQLLVETSCLLHLAISTLADKNSAWWLLATAIYSLPVCFAAIGGESSPMIAIFIFCSSHGFTPMAVTIYIAVFISLLAMSHALLLRFATSEATGCGNKASGHIAKLTLPSFWGITGEYIKLEIKSALRNKSVRRSFIQGALLMVAISFTITVAPRSGNETFSQSLWTLYCFMFFGVVNLTRIMGPEGNYIDVLMTHSKSIYALLKAKYYFYCAVLVVPLAILLPAAAVGKLSPWLVAACFFSASGPAYFILFQLAVSNCQTMPLNNRITGKVRNNVAMPLIVCVTVFAVPSLLLLLLQNLIGRAFALITLTAIGIAFTAMHRLWLKNVYIRMMHRKYMNLEGFHATK